MALKSRKSKRRNLEPQVQRPSVPATPVSGQLMLSAGKYARHMVIGAIEAVGGQERFNDWADENLDKLYTQLLPKIITKEVEDVQAADGLEKLLKKLDNEERGGVIDVEDLDVD